MMVRNTTQIYKDQEFNLAWQFLINIEWSLEIKEKTNSTNLRADFLDKTYTVVKRKKIKSRYKWV